MGHDTSAGDVISIVDDDESFREALTSLLRSLGFTARAFASAEDYLASGSSGETSCLLLDIRLPGMDGLTLQQALIAGQRPGPPIVFLTAHGDGPTRARALAAGAVDFLAKPFSEEALLDAVHTALGASRSRQG